MDEPLARQLRRAQRRMRSIEAIARAVGSTLDLDALLHLIVEEVPRVMGAERATLYLLTDDRAELWTRVLQADELREIRLKVGEGIAGWVAETGEAVSVPDAYADPRFSPAADQRSGFRTRAVLCVPLRDRDDRVLGVLQALNRRGGGPFTGDDAELLRAMAAQAAVALENAKLFRELTERNRALVETRRDLERRVRELDLLLEVEQVAARAASLGELLEGVLVRTAALIGAEAASVALFDPGRQRLRITCALGSRRERVLEAELEPGQGIAGWVAVHGEPVVANDPAADPRHDRALAERVGLPPRSIACAPLPGAEGPLGAVELINKVGEGGAFDEGDLRLLSLVAGRLAAAVELARAREERARQERLAGIGRLLSGVLHDLRTPMTIASGYAQLMARSDRQEEREEYLGYILKQFEVMQAMTREVLAFARGEAEVLFRKVLVQAFLEEAAAAVRPELEEAGVTLSVEARYRGAAVLDENKLLRVFTNIARNAAQAMPEGGRLEVVADRDGDELVLTFADTGPGIPAEMEGRLFDLFATGRGGGTGLGLAIVKRIVDLHGGRVSHRPRPGGGTIFEVRLPLTRPDEDGGEARDAA